mmetsp:Transcript_5190/g.16586  ORF Transcript_5190/g.16586 Transcript_5190/m.16586 type:complete len:203 (-) Transcript_5190:571-1179(-)
MAESGFYCSIFHEQHLTYLITSFNSCTMGLCWRILSFHSLLLSIRSLQCLKPLSLRLKLLWLLVVQSFMLIQINLIQKMFRKQEFNEAWKFPADLQPSQKADSKTSSKQSILSNFVLWYAKGGYLPKTKANVTNDMIRFFEKRYFSKVQDSYKPSLRSCRLALADPCMFVQPVHQAHVDPESLEKLKTDAIGSRDARTRPCP